MEESIGSMLDRLYPEERKALHVFVLFADTDPASHPNWKDPWTQNPEIVDEAATYSISELDMQRVQSAETRRDWYDKGLFDYQYVLSKCMNDTAAPYVAIFVDDIIFADGWLSRTLNALAELKQRARNKVAARKWIYLRLFYTESSLRWREADFWYMHMHFALLGWPRVCSYS